MSVVGVQFKIMPEGIDTNLEKLEEKIKSKIESFDSGIFNESKEEPIAFGLKALIVTFALSEEIEIDEVENSLKELEGVLSAELIDYRRAIG
jgi:translation elongation factor aEF-1 beta|tara:strand:- start:1442 stop:1717 length:276 start_codon:yes stop_codon:yes gene_type:complete